MTFLFSNIAIRNEALLRSHMEAAPPNLQLVLLNTAVPLQSDLVQRHSNKMLVRRWHRKSSTYLGGETAEKFVGPIYYLEGPSHNLPPAPWVENYPGFPQLIPTTGFWIWMLLAQRDEKLMLINFLGRNDNTTMKAACHNWDFEHAFIHGNHPADRFIDVTDHEQRF